MIAIVILAAGASSRMQGRDKLMEDVDGMPLLRRQTMRALATGCEVLVALPPKPNARYGALTELDVVTVPVPDAAEGMNASLRAALAAVPQAAQAAMVVLADMPDISDTDMSTVLHAVDFSGNNLIWRAVTQAGEAGHPIVFHRCLFPALMALDGDQGGSPVVKANRGAIVAVPLPDSHARTDLDTPAAWAAWRAKRSVT